MVVSCSCYLSTIMTMQGQHLDRWLFWAPAEVLGVASLICRSVASLFFSCWKPAVLSRLLFFFILQWRYLNLNSLKIYQVLWDNASNEQGLHWHSCRVSQLDTRLLGVAWIFYKRSFNELSRLFPSSLFAGGPITSSLFKNEDMAPGTGRSEVISAVSAESREMAQMAVRCRTLRSFGNVFNSTSATTCGSCKSS